MQMSTSAWEIGEQGEQMTQQPCIAEINTTHLNKDAEVKARRDLFPTILIVQQVESLTNNNLVLTSHEYMLIGLGIGRRVIETGNGNERFISVSDAHQITHEARRVEGIGSPSSVESILGIGKPEEVLARVVIAIEGHDDAAQVGELLTENERRDRLATARNPTDRDHHRLETGRRLRQPFGESRTHELSHSLFPGQLNLPLFQ